MSKWLRSWGLLWLFVMLMILALAQLLLRTQVQTDMSAFMPRAQTQAQQLLLQQLEEGPAARLWMLALTQAAPEKLAHISKALAQRAVESPRVAWVLNGNMSLDASTRDQLFTYRYLLSDRIVEDSFSQQGLQRMFGELLDILRSPMSIFSKQWLKSDPGGEFLHLLQSLGSAGSAPALKHGVWFNDAEEQALLLLQSSASGTNLDAQGALRNQLMSWLDELVETDASSRPIALQMGGVPLISLETREHIRHTSQRLSVLASIFMLGFMFLVYRQPRKVLFTALPLLSGVLLGAACVSWWFAGIHGITLAFGITLLGIAVDYPVHLLSHQRSSENLQHTAVRIWPTLALSVLSTLLGFSIMLWTDFPGLAQLGLFSVTGLLTAALVTRYLLPLMAGSLPASASRERFPPIATRLPRTGGRIKWLVVVLLVLGMAWVIQGKDLWSRDIQALSPVPAEVRLTDHQMRQVMGAPEPGHVMLMTADSVQQLLVKQERIQPLLAEAVSRGYIQGADYAARILPSAQLQRQRQAWIPASQTLTHDLQQSLAGLPFKSASFSPFVEALQHTRQLPPMMPEQLDNSLLEMRFNSLQQSTGKGVNGLIQLLGVQDVEALAELLKVSSQEDLWLLNIPAATSELVDQFRQEILHKALLAMLLIGLLAALWLRNWRRWLSVMLPVVLSVGVSVTVVLVTGASLNLFHLVSLLLVAGISLDYALFFSRAAQESAEQRQTAYALAVCCFSTVVVFSLLAASDIPVLHAIGLTVASGAASAFVLSWLIAAPR